MIHVNIQRRDKFRFSLSAHQQALLVQYAGIARWAWNTVLSFHTHGYKLLGDRLTGEDAFQLDSSRDQHSLHRVRSR